jgi:PAS domain S-box-containing protein
VETAIEGIWTIDAEGRTTFVNQKMAAMLGYSPGEMLGTSFLDFMDEPARAEATAAFARRAAGVSEQIDFRFRHKSGRDVWTRLSTGPIVDEAGRFAGALAMATDITESRAAAEALGFVERRLRVVLDNVTDGFFTMDREWRYTDINLAGARMLGKTVEDLVGRRSLDAFPEAAGTVWEMAYRRVMKTGEPMTVDGYYEPLDTWFEASVFPFAGGISVFLRDITIRKRAERAAQDSETRLRATVDVLRRSREALQKAQQIAHLGNWEWDVPTGALTWSDEIYRIFGLDAQSFTPTYDAFLGTIHPDDRQTVVDAVDAALAGRGAYSVEHRILRPDGSERVVHEQAEVSRDEREQLTRMIGTVLDITERHRAEEVLRRTETQLRRLLDSSPVAIYSLAAGPSPRTTFVSENVTSVLGYGAHELVNDASLWRDRLHPDDVHRTLPELGRVLEHGVASLQYRFRHKDGHYVWVRDESKLIRDADGGPLEIVGVLEDVTSRVELDEQLRQAQKLEVVGQLAGGIAHDFNNLLQVIGGHAELLLALPDATAAMHAMARTIRTAADRGATLARQLLAYSRRQVLQPRIVDVNRLVADVKAMMDPVVGAGLSIETRLAPDLAAVSIDHDQFEQVLMNLLGNARDAMPGGGVITIETVMVDLAADNAHRPFDVPAGRYAAVSVHDEGLGIDDETLPHLFEPFFTTKPVGKGVGLGLASVYGVLTQSGGYIAVLSERGRGATFTILLPPV